MHWNVGNGVPDRSSGGSSAHWQQSVVQSVKRSLAWRLLHKQHHQPGAPMTLSQSLWPQYSRTHRLKHEPRAGHFPDQQLRDAYLSCPWQQLHARWVVSQPAAVCAKEHHQQPQAQAANVIS